MKFWVLVSLITFVFAADAVVDLEARWSKGTFHQSDQGRLGTCHAFSLAPLVDFMENSSIRENSKQMDYRVSENWLVFLSTLDRLCSADDQEVRINQGWSISSDAKRMFDLGYCASQSYADYDGTNPHKKSVVNAKDLVKIDADLKQSKGILKPGLEGVFEASFGVSAEDAKKLCGSSSYEIQKLIEKYQGKPGVGRQFAACLSESTLKKKELQRRGCRIENKVYASEGDPSYKPEREMQVSREKLDVIRGAISTDHPVWIGIRDYPNGEPRVDGHTWHAVAFTGYNNQTEQFKVLNSWGPDGNDPVKYKMLPNIADIGWIDCKEKQKFPRNLEEPEPVEGEPSRETIPHGIKTF